MSISANLAPLMASEKMDWNTPLNILEIVRRLGPISLDPATDASNPTGALRYYTPESDGLAQSWRGGGLVYCNPPYGTALKAWMGKAAGEGAAGAEIVMLVPARTDARWWQDNVPSAKAVCFWRGRLKFVGASMSAPFPSALIYWGDRPLRFREEFGTKGWIV